MHGYVFLCIAVVLKNYNSWSSVSVTKTKLQLKPCGMLCIKFMCVIDRCGFATKIV